MQNVKNRAWVKNAAIIFLAVLLVLTFFSNTIMNKSLPEVATQGVTSGPITVRVRGTGTVTAVGAYDLKADQTRKVQSVLVRVGQEVEPGELLFILGEGASEELEQAAENLRQLELSYKRAAAGMPVQNYAQMDREIAAARDALSVAQRAYDRAEAELLREMEKSPTVDAVDEYNKRLEQAQKNLNEAQAKLEKLKEEIATANEEAWAEVQKLQLKIRVLEAKEDELTLLIEAEQPSGGTGGETGGSGGETGGTGGETGGTGGETGGTGGETGETGETGGEAGTLHAAGRPFSVHFAPIGASRILRGVSTVGMTDEEKKLVEQYEAELELTLAGISGNEAKLAKVRELKQATQKELDAVQAQLNMTADARIEKANEEVAAAQASLDALLKQFGAVADNYIKARDELASAQKLLADLEDSRKQMGRSASSAAIDLQDLAEQVARARQKLEELSGGENNQVTSPVGGVIESIGYTAGNTAQKGEILCRIQVPDMGYTLSFSATNEQARRLRTGDSATVSNYYWGSEIVATLSSIQIDPQAPQTNKLLTFQLTGDVNPGAELTIAVGSRSQNYDTIVPNSAIRSDANGSFVLRLEARNSPLGNRYFARRVDVTVLGQDDVNAAVSGDLSWGDFVITTSDRPVSVGDQVRMTDNG